MYRIVLPFSAFTEHDQCVVAWVGALVLQEQLDELIEQLEGELASAEIFAALFELELAGRVRQMPGKNYVRSM